MKITAINNTNVNRNNSNNKNNNKNINKNPNFTGLADAAVAFWQFVDNGGRALQFTVEDMFGTNIPRTYKGAMAGYKYTGKVNVLALAQEAIREFLTGPTMCLAPMLFLSLGIKLSGKTANTHLENISNLSYLMKNIVKENENLIEPEQFKEDFYFETIKDLLEKSTGKNADDEKIKNGINSLLDKMKKYENASSKQENKTLLAEIKAEFENIVKNNKDNFKDTNFLKAQYSTGKESIGNTKFTNYVDYIISYANDYKKTNLVDGKIKLDNATIDTFKKSWLGKRALTVLSMIFGTAALMSIIPKIYTLASGKVNPNAAEVYNEANKNKKEAK